MHRLQFKKDDNKLEGTQEKNEVKKKKSLVTNFRRLCIFLNNENSAQQINQSS